MPMKRSSAEHAGSLIAWGALVATGVWASTEMRALVERHLEAVVAGTWSWRSWLAVPTEAGSWLTRQVPVGEAWLLVLLAVAVLLVWRAVEL